MSSSPDQIKDLWEELAAEGFTKGWVPAGDAPADKETETTQKPSVALTAADTAEAVPATRTKKRATRNAATVPAEEDSASSPTSVPPVKKDRASSKKETD